MPKELSWRDLSIRKIQESLTEYYSAQIAAGQPIEYKPLRKFVNDRYPFSQRKYSPYQVWLEELKQLEQFVLTGKPAAEYQGWRYGFKIDRRKKVDPTSVHPALQHLFDC